MYTERHGIQCKLWVFRSWRVWQYLFSFSCTDEVPLSLKKSIYIYLNIGICHHLLINKFLNHNFHTMENCYFTMVLSVIFIIDICDLMAPLVHKMLSYWRVTMENAHYYSHYTVQQWVLLRISFLQTTRCPMCLLDNLSNESVLEICDGKMKACRAGTLLLKTMQKGMLCFAGRG